VKEVAGAGAEGCSILSMPCPALGCCCWPKAKLSDPPKLLFGCCCACCAPKLKLLGVVVNVFGGVKVVLGPVKGDALRALPPRLILAILFTLLLVLLPNGVLHLDLGGALGGVRSSEST
jgi:hypothetical protein